MKRFETDLGKQIQPMMVRKNFSTARSTVLKHLLAIFLIFGNDPLGFSSNLQLEFGTPVTALSIQRKTNTDVAASNFGILFGAHALQTNGNLATSIYLQSDIGKAGKMITNSASFGLTWSLFQTMSAFHTSPEGSEFTVNPDHFQSISILISRNKFDITEYVDVPEKTVFIEDPPLLEGEFLGLQIRYKYHTRLGDSFLASQIFYERSISSPGQNIELTMFGLAMSYLLPQS